MTVALPGRVVWNAASWVVRGLCDDARPHLAAYPRVSPEFQECLDTELYYIDLEEASPETLDEAHALVTKVIADNQARGSASFHDPSAFPVYLGKLRDLEQLIAAARTGASAKPPPDRAPPSVEPAATEWTAQDGRVAVDEGLYMAFGQGVYRGHLVLDPQQKRLVTQARLRDDVRIDVLARELEMNLPGIAPVEYLGPVDGPDVGSWVGQCMVEVEPRGEPVIARLPLRESKAVALALDIVEVLERAHSASIAIGGLRPELIYVHHGPDGELGLDQLVPRAPLFLARARPLSSGNPPFTRLYISPLDAGDLPSPAGDVFALSATLFHLVSGVHPFGDHFLEQMQRVATGQRQPWPGSAALGAILAAGLEPHSAARISLSELAAGLRTVGG